MKSIFVMFGLCFFSFPSFAHGGGVDDWERVKSYCQRGAINNQDRAHKPVVTCSYAKSGGSYKEKTVRTVVIERDIVDDTLGHFEATFSTDKSKRANTYSKEIYVAGRANKDEVLPSLNEDCKSTVFEEKINFEYGRADTCKIMKDKTSPKTFCDFIYRNVFDAQERAKYTIRDVKVDKACLSGSKP